MAIHFDNPVTDHQKADKLLQWSFMVCKDVQKTKTYGNRFPETASLGADISDYFQSLRDKGECTCQAYEHGLVANDCEMHGDSH